MWLGSTDGGNSGVIVGGGGNPGVATFFGALPGDPLLKINVTTGISQHLASGQGSLDLNSVNLAVGPHAGTDTLYILLSDVRFGPATSGTLQLSIGGTLDPGTSLTAWSRKDPEMRFGVGCSRLCRQGHSPVRTQVNSAPSRIPELLRPGSAVTRTFFILPSEITR